MPQYRDGRLERAQRLKQEKVGIFWFSGAFLLESMFSLLEFPQLETLHVYDLGLGFDSES